MDFTNFSLTENGAVSHATTYSGVLNLFVQSVRGCSETRIYKMMNDSWNNNPLLTVKLIYLTRDPRNGKGERDISHFMLKWLKKTFYNTYILNIGTIAKDYGRFDMLVKLHNKFNNTWFELQILADQLHLDSTSEHPSLAAKWAPREKSSNANVAYQLSFLMYPECKDAQKQYRQLISRLTKTLDVIEQKLCEKKWDEINYSNVPASAMKLYGRSETMKYSKKEQKLQPGTFIRHDKTRFDEYRQRVKEGKEEIKISGIQPHDLVKAITFKKDETIELQWTALIEKLSTNVNFSGALAVVDVSGSMGGQPMEVAMALGLIIAELTQKPFKNKMITFHETPLIHDIKGDSLYEKVLSMRESPWGGNTNFEAVFDLILTTANTYQIPQSQMVKTLFVFTDMQFDDAHNKSTDTLFDTITEKYRIAGYVRPKMVFWNLRVSESKAFPVTMDEYDTAYVSGFSAELLKVFMSGCDFNPMTILSTLLEKYPAQVDPVDALKNITIPIKENDN
jgi:hypothetical protein